MKCYTLRFTKGDTFHRRTVSIRINTGYLPSHVVAAINSAPFISRNDQRMLDSKGQDGCLMPGIILMLFLYDSYTFSTFWIPHPKRGVFTGTNDKLALCTEACFRNFIFVATEAVYELTIETIQQPN
jgi:hypothetical protein